MKYIPAAWFLAGMLFQACSNDTATRPVRVAGENAAQRDTCDDPDASIHCSFLHMPGSLTPLMEIKGDEGAVPLGISGTMFHADGKTPYAGVILYAYHTNREGQYAKGGFEQGAHKWHGQLHGWCRTDSNGRYAISTTRPGNYPGRTDPAHIHAAVKTPGGDVYWINDFVFSDDELVDEKFRASIGGIGGDGIMDLVKNGAGFQGTRDIVLR